MKPNTTPAGALNADCKHSHVGQSVIPDRAYQIVIVKSGSERIVLSRYRSFIAAERIRRFLPTVDGGELRIESMPVECAE